MQQHEPYVQGRKARTLIYLAHFLSFANMIIIAFSPHSGESLWPILFMVAIALYLVVLVLTVK